MNTRHLRALLAALLVASVGLAGCRQSPTKKAESRELDPDEIARVEPAHLKVRTTGDISFIYEADVDLRFVIINDPEATSLQLLSVGLQEMKPLQEGGQFRAAFDLAGTYKGPGKYVLPAMGGPPKVNPSLDPNKPDPNAAAAGLSRPYLIYLRLKPGATAPSAETLEIYRQFENPQEPCQIEVGRGERTGKITCPKVSDSEGRTVSFVMEWRKT